ncbi:MAG TPA: tetratricopeptide repeat protein [Pyrinomonadaceae bacterium]|jgi:tetratricopeptide (TPR) repeat protein|nr:tetratricopeptide repeat protein [Pyrinomonadaceae bacterium]
MFKKRLNRTRGLVSLLLLVAFAGPYAHACLWPSDRIVRKPLAVEGVSAQEFVRRLTSHEGRAFWEKTRAGIERRLTTDPYVDSRNDLAVTLVHLGRVKEAVALLEELEDKRPGFYFTAANLGTAYELSGENEKALKWIKECIKRNKDSHYGTEWLHVKILEAKLGLESDPDWLKKNSVTGADFRGEGDPQQPKRLARDHTGRQKSLAEIEAALVYQLHERLEFVKPPDPVVADLLYDLSNVLALTRTSEHAEAIHELSLSYNPVQEVMVSIRQADKSVTQKSAPRPPDLSRVYLLYAALFVAALLTVTGFYLLIRRRRLQGV